jgi:polyisoprenoid-binding protein YceI
MSTTPATPGDTTGTGTPGTGTPGTDAAASAPGERRPRHRRLRRWLIGVGSAVLVLLVVVVVAARGQSGGPPPLTLPAAAAAGAAPTTVGLDGTWAVGPGSVAGFRVGQTSFGRTVDVVGRTGGVAGTVTAAGGRLTAATLTIDLTTITVNGAPSQGFADALDAAGHPAATFTLTRPIEPAAATSSGTAVTATATGTLEIRGAPRTVSFPVTARQDGATLRALGTIPVTFTDYGIQAPRNYAPIGALADHGVAEFLLVLTRS